VMIRRHARDIAVVMSAEEYKRIRQTRVQGRVRAGLSPTEYLERE
jgi:PHD/YefM family antitoxin component YafN of YafNO toxin-antitoxin module